jgi:hypothetical protein
MTKTIGIFTLLAVTETHDHDKEIAEISSMLMTISHTCMFVGVVLCSAED